MSLFVTASAIDHQGNILVARASRKQDSTCYILCKQLYRKLQNEKTISKIIHVNVKLFV